ncbi:MAG: tRNA lysidine(34) synthetase TilS [Bacteroidales bacterium]|nr:tRNA lysidine(34) synthetase TilS [Bacteroidales bacterium]
MLERFKSFITNENLFRKEEKIIVSVSGGIDSVVMAGLFAEADFKFVIAHCNFNLRGRYSDEDEDFVSGIAERYKVDFFVKKFNTREFASQNKVSVQMAARQLRLQWMQDILANKIFSFFATAHHLDDHIETFFINLLRGTGISGLHGILPKKGNCIRPLLFAWKKEIFEFATSRNIPYKEDHTNRETVYLRNKIRHHLIPTLETIDPNFRIILQKNIERFRKAETIYKREVENKSSKLLMVEEDSWKINLDQLSKLPDPDIYLYETLRPFQFNYSDVCDILDPNGSNSGTIFYSSGYQILRNRNNLIIQGKKDLPLMEEEYLIHEYQSEVKKPLSLECLKFSRTPEFKLSRTPELAHIDFDRIVFPLKIRRWHEGDYFFPLGMKNKKKLSDFFIDQKFSIFDKKNTWVIESSGQIIWIVGKRLSDIYKVTSKTTTIFQIKI